MEIFKTLKKDDLCPCGSGKKFKDCCLPILKKVELKSKEIDRMKKDWEKQYGKVRSIVHCNASGHKFVAVGNTLYWSKDWKVFPDFLMDYIKIVLGREWLESNVSKPYKERHEIIKWLEKMTDFQKQQKKDIDGLYSAIPNGAMLAYMTLAYDIYTLRHHSALQNEVIKRLKNPKQFQGALYELFVAATFIRAGFEINYEDETDRSKNHPEFIAVHKKTGQKISVEAKSRHREGLLGYPGETSKQVKIRIIQLINKALRKVSHYPFIIFIDLNLPVNINKSLHQQWIKKIMFSFSKKFNNNLDDHKLFNYIFLTDSHPFSIEENSSALTGKTLHVISNNPKFKIINSDKIFSDLKKAESQFDNIPVEFPKEFDNIII